MSIILHHTTRTEAYLPCARCQRLAALETLERVATVGLWVCRDRHSCWFAQRDNARIAAALRAEGAAA